MNGMKPVSLHSQRGVSLSGLIVVLGVIIAVAMLGMKVFPSILEYRSAKDGIIAAKRMGGSVPEMKASFTKHAEINMVTAIKANDLIITKDNNETQLAFDYEQKIPLFTDVHLVIRYSGTTDPSGVIPEAPETPAK